VSATPKTEALSDRTAHPALNAAGRSQLLFREVNEQILGIANGFDLSDRPPAPYLLCECENDCFEHLEVTQDTYEAIRRFPTRFVVLEGHESADDRVIERFGRSTVVEKVGSGAELAVRFDPRRGSIQGDTDGR
jgi:hypothetical protein